MPYHQLLNTCPGIQNYAFQNSKLDVSLVGPCFTSVRYKDIHLQGPFCTQITPKFAHFKRHSTLEAVATSIRTLPNLKTLKKATAFFIAHI